VRPPGLYCTRIQIPFVSMKYPEIPGSNNPTWEVEFWDRF